MCGIFGTIKAAPSHNRMLTIFNETRGRDSVGVLSDMRRMRVAKSPTEAIIKRCLPDRIFNATVFLGHTRSKTHGAATKQNAHPFRFGNIVGAHNGVISNFYELKHKYRDEHKEVDKMQVDSEIIFWLLSKYGTDGLKELDGYAAIWWQDVTKPERVFMWAWANEFSICENTIGDKPALAFSSVEDHLLLAGFKQPKRIKGNGTVLEIDTDSASVVNEYIIEGAKTRQRGEWRSRMDDDLFERTGVPRKYGASEGRNPTWLPSARSNEGTSTVQEIVTSAQTTSFPTGAGLERNITTLDIEDPYFYLCHKCYKLMPEEVIVFTGEKTSCPCCGSFAEPIDDSDAEWLWDAEPDAVMTQEEIDKYRNETNKEKANENEVEFYAAASGVVVHNAPTPEGM